MNIQEIYHARRIEHASTPLERWYNQLLTKPPEEMTNGDILRCLRQDMFTKTALEMLFQRLQADPYAGDLFDGELMEVLSNLSVLPTAHHRHTIEEIMLAAESTIEQHAWCNEEDREEYKAALSKVKTKLSEP